jgi:ATP-dependent RNA helicase SUPV3L1/SUV3
MEETEVFYIFTWGVRLRERKVVSSNKNSNSFNKVKDKKLPGKDNKSHYKNNKTETSQTTFSKKDKPIDPDNPFAAALKGFNKN